MNNKSIHLNTAALRFLGDSIKAMAKRSTVGDRELANYLRLLEARANGAGLTSAQLRLLLHQFVDRLVDEPGGGSVP